MGFWEFRAPTSVRLSLDNAWDAASMTTGSSTFVALQNQDETHPSIPHLVLLVFGAVLEVVCVSLPGYIIARLGHFDAEKQKFLANLNVMLFTPCLSMHAQPRTTNHARICRLLGLLTSASSLHQARFPIECR